MFFRQSPPVQVDDTGTSWIKRIRPIENPEPKHGMEVNELDEASLGELSEDDRRLLASLRASYLAHKAQKEQQTESADAFRCVRMKHVK